MVFALGLALTAAWLHWLRQSAENEDHLRFVQQADLLQSDILARFHLPHYGLAGLRASIAAAGGVLSRSSFRDYVAARDLESEFPGVRGFAFVQHIARGSMPAFEAAERSAGAPWFSVRSSGDAPDLYVIRYIEPLSRNFAALGFDLGSESLRRQAIERAVDTGAPTLTAPLILLQDQRRGPGFLYIVPIYRFGSDPTTAEQRRAALLGLAYTPMVLAELLAATAVQQGGRLDFRLTAGAGAAQPLVVFDSERALVDTAGAAAGAGSVYADRHFAVTRRLQIGQQEFGLEVATTASFERASRGQTAWSVGVGGVLLSLLLASTVWLLARGRARALATAASMTTELDRLAKVAQRTSNAVVITDADRRITWVNEGFTRLSGYTLDEVVGRVPGHVLQSENTDPTTVERLRTLLATGEGFRAEVCNRSKDGQDYWVDVDVQPVRDAQGCLSGYMAIETDITEARATRLSLERLAREQAVMLDSEIVGISKLRDRVSVWSNAGLARMFGYSVDALRGQPARLLYTDDASYEALGAQAYPVIRAGETFRTQLQMRHSSGKLLWIDLSGIQVSSETDESMWLMVDITAMKQAHGAMEQAAFHDALTGLPNRALLADRLAQALEAAKRQGQPLVVAYMDLDGFKAVNDGHGHDAGDAVLRTVAQRLPSTLRSSDTVARIGGDEFVILLSPAGTVEEVRDVMHRVQAEMRQPVALANGDTVSVGASLGLAWYPLDGDDATELLSIADRRMFESKRGGRAAPLQSETAQSDWRG